MDMKNKCQNCGCEDTFLPVAPCSDPAECPTPQKCEETFDSACVIYTGLNLDCGTDTVVATNTSIEQALQNIVDKVCEITSGNLVVEITDNEGGLAASVSGGSAPYQFLWSIEQGTFVGHTITGGANFSSVILSPIVGNTFQVGGISGATGAVNMSHIRLDVTDGALNKTTRYYTFANLV